MNVTQSFNHADNVAILGIHLLHLGLVALVPTQTNLMASRERVFVRFNIVSYFLRRMLVHEPDGTLGRTGTVGCGLRGGFFKHGGANGIRGIMWSGVQAMLTPPIIRTVNILWPGEGALQIALLPLDCEISFQCGGHGGLVLRGV